MLTHFGLRMPFVTPLHYYVNTLLSQETSHDSDRITISTHLYLRIPVLILIISQCSLTHVQEFRLRDRLFPYVYTLMSENSCHDTGRRQSWLFPANFGSIFGCFWLFKTTSWLSPADASSHRHSLLVSAWHVLHTNVTTHMTKVPRYDTDRIIKSTNLFPRIPVMIMTAWKCPPNTDHMKMSTDTDCIMMLTHFFPKSLSWHWPYHDVDTLLSEDPALRLHHRVLLGVVAQHLKRRNHQLTNLVRTGITNDSPSPNVPG